MNPREMSRGQSDAGSVEAVAFTVDPHARSAVIDRAQVSPSAGRGAANLWVPRMSSGPFSWTFVGVRPATKLGHGAVLPVPGIRPDAPIAPPRPV